ncbi:MAG: hypothetical protein WAW80_03030 [Candidatus Saccharimonadales bacterium]
MSEREDKMSKAGIGKLAFLLILAVTTVAFDVLGLFSNGGFLLIWCMFALATLISFVVSFFADSDRSDRRSRDNSANARFKAQTRQRRSWREHWIKRPFIDSFRYFEPNTLSALDDSLFDQPGPRSAMRQHQNPTDTEHA